MSSPPKACPGRVPATGDTGPSVLAEELLLARLAVPAGLATRLFVTLPLALGAAAAVQAAGKGGQVRLVGFDNIAALKPLLADGRVLATADQHGDQLAVYGIEFALQILRGDTAPADRQTPVDVITRTR